MAVITLLVIAFTGLRMATRHYGLWFDEMASLWFSDQPLSRLWGSWMRHETNPPLFYTLLKGWRALGFQTVDGLRLLPILGGAINFAALAAVAWLGWGRRAAVAAVVLAGLSTRHVYISQLLRAYVFEADAWLISLAGLLLMMASHRSRMGFWLYVCGATLAVYFHTTMLLWIAIATVALPLANPGDWRPSLLQMAKANAIVLGISAWWLWVTWLNFQTHSPSISWIPHLSLKDYFRLLSHNALLIDWQRDDDTLTGLVIFGAALLGCFLTLRRPETRLITLCAVMGMLAMQAGALVHPIATDTTVFWLSFFPMLLIAAGIAAVRPAWIGNLMLASLGIMLGARHFAPEPFRQRQEFDVAVRTVAQRPNAALVVETAYMQRYAARACMLEFPSRPCPIPIITLVLRPLRHGSSIMPSAAAFRPDDAKARLRRFKRFYTLRFGSLDPASKLGIRPPPQPHQPAPPYLEGPFRIDQIKAKHWPAVAR